MILRKVINILLLFIAISANAQPGGGGGLEIMAVWDHDGNPITKNNASLQIQHYILSNKTHKVIQGYVMPDSEKSKNTPFIYLPEHITIKKKRINTINQRLVLIYKNDTMTVDFIDILQENGAGLSDRMERIRFISGYFKCYLRPQKSHVAMWEKINLTGPQKNEALNLLKTGIDYSTLSRLKNIGLMEHVPDPNIENKRLQRERDNCEELPVGKYMNLCYDKIALHDKDSTINISTNQLPVRIDSCDYYRFLYFFPFDNRLGLNNVETQLANTTLRKLVSYKIKINGNIFSGKIKNAVLYNNVGISRTYSKYMVYENKYQNGKLLISNILNDVNIATDEIMERAN